MTDQQELPRYKCLKTVWALKIRFVNPVEHILMFEEDGYAPINVGEAYFKKHTPYIGGYFVVYEDGYQSFSPPEVFESGYALIT